MTDDPYTSFDWKKYEVLAQRTWDPARIKTSPMRYLIRGYSSELGEMSDELKRWAHSQKPGLHDRLLLEVGDCLWYATMLRSQFDACSSQTREDCVYTSLKSAHGNGHFTENVLEDTHFHTDIAVGLAQANLYSGVLAHYATTIPPFRGDPFNTDRFAVHRKLLLDIEVWPVSALNIENIEFEPIKDVARIAIAAGVSLVEAADRNIQKLEARVENDSVLATSKRNPS